jgi:hypothetical protein
MPVVTHAGNLRSRIHRMIEVVSSHTNTTVMELIKENYPDGSERTANSKQNIPPLIKLPKHYLWRIAWQDV